jgi:hypothetical protein
MFTNLFFPKLIPPQTRFSPKLYPKKMRLETSAKCKVVGSWLCTYATNGFFMLLLSRAYFLYHSARSDYNKHIFYVVLQEKQ